MKPKGPPEAWTPPKWIVLVRSGPEEAVLTIRKWAGYSTPSGTLSDGWTSPGMKGNKR